MHEGKLVLASSLPAKPHRNDRSEDFPMMRPPFKRGWSPIHGRKLRSWSDYHKGNKELGLIDVGGKMDMTPPPKFEHVSFDDMPAARIETGEADDC